MESYSSEDVQVVAFDIILHSGEARTSVHNAFAEMRQGRFGEAERLLDEAQEKLVEAHRAQTRLLHDYANEKAIPMEIILVHAQDHLMTCETLREMALEMLELYKAVK